MNIRLLRCGEPLCNYQCWTYEAMIKHAETAHFPTATANERIFRGECAERRQEPPK